MEFIPGGDDRHCSYYTYIDETGNPLFHFTKRLLRRHRANEGGATYHITDWNPEVAEKGLRLLQHVGLRGLGNVEFKRDPRDGELKLIEVNARLHRRQRPGHPERDRPSPAELRPAHGKALRDIPCLRLGLVMLDPIPDFLAFRELNARRNHACEMAAAGRAPTSRPTSTGAIRCQGFIISPCRRLERLARAAASVRSSLRAAGVRNR